MNIKHFSIVTMIALLAFACGGGTSEQSQQEDPKTAEEQLWEEVMAVHDEVMPKMSQISRLRRRLRDYRENQSTLDPQVEQRIEAALQDLDTADDSMMEWMGNLKQLDGLREQQSHEEIMNYLETEKESIDQVRDDMLGAIEEAQKLTQELGISPEAQ